MLFREVTHQNQGRHQFWPISLKALIKSIIQLLETNKLGFKYKRNKNTWNEN